MSTSFPLEEEIHQNIPLSRAMDFHIEKLSRHQILVSAPMEPNINIHGTGFAGSIYALGVLSAWGLIKHNLDKAGLDASLVIGKANIQYKKPIVDEITCNSYINERAGQLFLDRLIQQGKSKIIVDVICGKNAEATIEAHMHAIILN